MELIDLSEGIVMDELKDMIRDYYSHAKEVMGFDKPAKIVLRHNEKNANEILGRTGEYIPSRKKIVILSFEGSKRKPKKISIGGF